MSNRGTLLLYRSILRDCVRMERAGTVLVPRDPPDPRMWGIAHWKDEEVPSSKACLQRVLPTLSSEVPNQEVFKGRDLIHIVRNEFR